MTIKFGTEGWRAVMADEFTVENVRIVTQAIAEHYLEQRRSGSGALTLAVGHDTRFLSPMFAKAVCEVLAGNGIRAVLTDRAVPTCAVSRYVVDKQLPAGIMVTASHNPAIYNGLKIKAAYGGSATSDTVAAVERRIGGSSVKRVDLDDAIANAAVVQSSEFVPMFLKGIRAFIDLPLIRRSRFHVIAEAMHGAAGTLVEQLIGKGACRVDTLHGDPDPRFGGRAPEPIPSNLTDVMAAVKRRHADLAICNDGDADRLGIIGPNGMWLNPGQVMCVLIKHLSAHRGMKGAVVKTVSNTMMINRLCDAQGITLIETPVGFKYIAQLMLEQDILIGGEESGGIGVKGYMPERDGIVNGLLTLEAMAARKQKLSVIMAELEKSYGQWFYGRRDLHLKMEQVETLFSRLTSSPPESLAGIAVASVNRLDGVKLIGRDDSWLLFRRSGTEPIVRIYAESPKKSQLSRLLEFGVGLIGR